MGLTDHERDREGKIRHTHFLPDSGYVTFLIIMIMKYFLSMYLKYIPELGMLYKEKRRKKARTVQQQ